MFFVTISLGEENNCSENFVSMLKINYREYTKKRREKRELEEKMGNALHSSSVYECCIPLDPSMLNFWKCL